MSLHTLASQLQNAGRGEDKVLVHMTPGEVKGLQSLAMAHGGSLTINPETGLPEAGILSSLLPMVAGFFLGPAGLGLTAMQSALAVGALGTAATGSLGKGFMMGMGAYGGAGLGQGLSAAGAAAPTTGSGASYGSWAASDAGKLAAEQAANSAKDIATSTAVGPVNPATNGLQALSPSSPFANTAVNASSYTQQFAPTGSMGNLAAPPVDATTMISKPAPYTDVFTGGAPDQLQSASMRQTALDKATADSIAAQQKLGITSNMPSSMDNVGAGFKKATSSWEGLQDVWDKTPKGTGYGLAATGLSALQSQREDADAKAKAEAAALAGGKKGTIRPYEFSTEQDPNAYANTSTAESNYFVEPRFIPKATFPAKEGGLMSYAVGGPVEQMSAENAIGDNMMYPQSQLQTSMYSNPMVQRPMPQNVIRSGLDALTESYTGEPQKFASGGAAEEDKKRPAQDLKYSYNPDTMQYTKTETVRPETQNKGFGMMSLNPMFEMFGMGPVFKNQNYGNTQPATTTTTSVGGMSAPYVPPGMAGAAPTAAPQQMPTTGIAQAMPFVPTTQIPQQQPVNQQLGLESFYPMMEQQLAMKGAQLGTRGYAEGGTANGGYSLGSYSDGGRLLRGPGDGVSDSIPASIGSGQPARLADGEFVVPARIVSEIGNGSTEAGARKLYAMMDRVQKARGRTVGKNKVAVNTKADKLLPA